MLVDSWILFEAAMALRRRSISQVYIDKAISALDKLPDIQAKKDLIEVAHFIGNRSLLSEELALSGRLRSQFSDENFKEVVFNGKNISYG